MLELKVLGIGSPFGMDQLGWEVVKILQENETLLAYPSHQLQLTCHDRPGMGLLELMQGAKTVFLVDAIQGRKTFHLHCLEDDALDDLVSPSSTHQIGIAEVIKMGKILYCLPENIKLYGIEIPAVEQQLELPATLQKPIQELSNKLINDIHRKLTVPGCN